MGQDSATGGRPRPEMRPRQPLNLAPTLQFGWLSPALRTACPDSQTGGHSTSTSAVGDVSRCRCGVAQRTAGRIGRWT